MMKLISATPSPYARKVRIALAEKGIPFELVTEVPWNDGAQAAELNPLEKLPVLTLDDGTTLYESSYILEYLEVKYPDPPLYPADPDARLAARKLEVLSDGVCDAIVLAFFESLRPESHRSAPWRERQMRKITGGVGAIADLVPEDGFCVGEEFGLADIAVGTVLGYLDIRCKEVEWREPYPHLAALNTRLSARPSFQNTVPTPQTLQAGVI